MDTIIFTLKYTMLIISLQQICLLVLMSTAVLEPVHSDLQSGTGNVSFAFPVPWFQSMESTYYLLVVDVNSEYTVKAATSLVANNECVVNMCNGSMNCSARLYYVVHYEQYQCCTPCYSNATCSSSRVCECQSGYQYSVDNKCIGIVLN